MTTAEKAEQLADQIEREAGIGLARDDAVAFARYRIEGPPPIAAREGSE